MTAKTRPYRAATLPETACAEHQYEARMVIEDGQAGWDLVTFTAWCRVCLLPLIWSQSDTNEARLYCRPLPVAAQSGETT